MTKQPKSRFISARADTLDIHPVAQRDIVRAKLNKMIADFDLDAVGVLHGVEYPIRGKSKIWIVDGQHRLAALLHHGFGEWQCRVQVHTDVDNDAAACALFLRLNTRAPVSSYDKFEKAAKAGNADAVGVVRIAKRHGLEISKFASDTKLACVTSATKLHALDGGKTFDAVLDTAIEAWGRTAVSMDGRLLEGLGVVLKKHGDNIEIEALIKKLATYPGGAASLLGDARGLMQHRRTTVTRCIAERIVDTYNLGRRARRLGSEAA